MAGRRFRTTRWSVVLATRDPSATEARQALSLLCETYWTPVYDFVRFGGRRDDEARDLTQAFFARVIEKGDFRHARPELGRFRTFLLTAVRHFLANQREHEHAIKRGGGQVHLTLDALPEAGRADARPIDPATVDTPETIYERRWALTALEAAMTRLAARYDPDRRLLFDALKPFMTGEPESSFAAVAQRLGMAESSVRVALHRLRRQYGECLRETLADTVSDASDVDRELSYLLDVLSRDPDGSSLKHSGVVS